MGNLFWDMLPLHFEHFCLFEFPVLLWLRGAQPKAKSFLLVGQEMAAKNFLQMFNNFFTWKCPQPGNRGRITSFFIYLFKFLQLFVIYTIKFNVSNKTHNLTQWKTVKKVVPLTHDHLSCAMRRNCLYTPSQLW